MVKCVLDCDKEQKFMDWNNGGYVSDIPYAYIEIIEPPGEDNGRQR